METVEPDALKKCFQFASKDADSDFVRIMLQSPTVVSALDIADLETAYIQVHHMASSKERNTAHELIKHFLVSDLTLSSESWDLVLLDSMKSRLYDAVSDLILSDKSKDLISSRGYQEAFDYFTRDLDATFTRLSAMMCGRLFLRNLTVLTGMKSL